MGLGQQIRTLTNQQRLAFSACFLGWTLDAFDFFILTYCLDAVAAEFHTGLKTIAESIFWTLVMRPVGALLFGWLAERYGRKPTLMANILCFTVFEMASAFAPTLPLFLASRALFGIAMGGEWGVGAALALESLPQAGRGFFSGLLQEGYVAGNLLAAAAYGVFGLYTEHLHPGGFAGSWRFLFVVSALPAMLLIWVLTRVEESPAWRDARSKGPRAGKAEVKRYIPQLLYLTLLMFAFMSFSHGTQDLYATFLKKDHALSATRVSLVAIVSNFGAFFGGIFYGTMSERFGRKKAIIMATLLAIPVIPLWAWSHTMVLLAVGGFLMQFMVQGAWGVVPAHLNELSPGAVRAVLPGFAYQLGAFFSSRNIVFQTAVAAHFSAGRLAPVMAGTVVVIGLAVAVVTALGPEAKGADLSKA